MQPGKGTRPNSEKPFLQNYFQYLLGQVSSKIGRQFYRLHLKGRGVRPVQWWVLALLADEDRIGVTAIAARIGYAQPQATRLIDRMDRDGLIVRSYPTGDRRRVLIGLTKKGRSLVRELQSLAIEHEKEALKGLRSAEIAKIKSLLQGML